MIWLKEPVILLWSRGRFKKLPKTTQKFPNEKCGPGIGKKVTKGYSKWDSFESRRKIGMRHFEFQISSWKAKTSEKLPVIWNLNWELGIGKLPGNKKGDKTWQKLTAFEIVWNLGGRSVRLWKNLWHTFSKHITKKCKNFRKTSGNLEKCGFRVSCFELKGKQPNHLQGCSS